MSHLEAAGFEVTVTETTDIAAVKDTHGIPPRLSSCHTATVAGYIIEGHVPARDIRKLLKDKPPIRGLLLPGKPPGAPGLEGGEAKSFEVLALDMNGATQVFAVHRPGEPPQ